MVTEFIPVIIVHVLTFYMYYFVHVYENIWLAGDYNCVYLMYSNDITCTSQNIMKLLINDFYKIIKIIYISSKMILKICSCRTNKLFVILVCNELN